MWANNNKKRFLHVQSMCYSDGVKDTSHKTKAKDSTRNARAKAKDSTLKAKDFKIVLEDPQGRGLVLEDSYTDVL